MSGATRTFRSRLQETANNNLELNGKLMQIVLEAVRYSQGIVGASPIHVFQFIRKYHRIPLADDRLFKLIHLLLTKAVKCGFVQRKSGKYRYLPYQRPQASILPFSTLKPLKTNFATQPKPNATRKNPYGVLANPVLGKSKPNARLNNPKSILSMMTSLKPQEPRKTFLTLNTKRGRQKEAMAASAPTQKGGKRRQKAQMLPEKTVMLFQKKGKKSRKDLNFTGPLKERSPRNLEFCGSRKGKSKRDFDLDERPKKRQKSSFRHAMKLSPLLLKKPAKIEKSTPPRSKSKALLSKPCKIPSKSRPRTLKSPPPSQLSQLSPIPKSSMMMSEAADTDTCSSPIDLDLELDRSGDKSTKKSRIIEKLKSYIRTRMGHSKHRKSQTSKK